MSVPTGKLVNEMTGESFNLDEVNVIGRNQDSLITIADPRVSRKHAMIRRQEDGFWFLDLGSINGTYINGRRVTTSQALSQGDCLRIGDHSFRFDCVGGSSAPGLNELATDVTIADLRSADAILLVSDIKNFTGLSERLPPDELAPIIGSWYERTEGILAEHGANLDKFIGDSVLAYWLETTPEIRMTALRTAAALQRSCEEVQRQHHQTLARDNLQFRSGAAIHLGPTAYGAFSSKEFTLLGDAVNVVFRLESLTRELAERVLVSAELFEGWTEGIQHCRRLGNYGVKGRAQEVEVYALNDLGENKSPQA